LTKETSKTINKRAPKGALLSFAAAWAKNPGFTLKEITFY